jgi:hydrogenase expression/formation protein HypC
MCLAVPGKVVEVKGKKAVVDFIGVKKEADTSLVSVEVGEYVMVSAGFVTQKIGEEEALKSIEAWRRA